MMMIAKKKEEEGRNKFFNGVTIQSRSLCLIDPDGLVSQQKKPTYHTYAQKVWILLVISNDLYSRS